MTPKKIEIRSRWDNSVLYVAKGAADVRAVLEEAVARDANLRDANLGGAYLRGANLRGANLRGAYLRDANLRGAYLGGAYLRDANLRDANLGGANLRGAYLGDANLRDANLRDANLRGANLRGANLRGANLRGAKGFNPYAVNDLLLLQHQVGKIRAYKLVTSDGYGPYNGGIKYEVGETYEVKGADCDPEAQCGPGINLATLPWCIREWRPGYRILLAEFTAKDIAAIPTSDGKFRVHRAKIVKDLALAEIGLVDAR
jgi:pentapeptide repeat protein